MNNRIELWIFVTFNHLGQISDSSDNAVNTLMLMANGILTGNDDLENQNDKNECIWQR